MPHNILLLHFWHISLAYISIFPEEPCQKDFFTLRIKKAFIHSINLYGTYLLLLISILILWTIMQGCNQQPSICMVENQICDTSLSIFQFPGKHPNFGDLTLVCNNGQQSEVHEINKLSLKVCFCVFLCCAPPTDFISVWNWNI